MAVEVMTWADPGMVPITFDFAETCASCRSVEIEREKKQSEAKEEDIVMREAQG